MSYFIVVFCLWFVMMTSHYCVITTPREKATSFFYMLLKKDFFFYGGISGLNWSMLWLKWNSMWHSVSVLDFSFTRVFSFFLFFFFLWIWICEGCRFVQDHGGERIRKDPGQRPSGYPESIQRQSLGRIHPLRIGSHRRQRHLLLGSERIQRFQIGRPHSGSLGSRLPPRHVHSAFGWPVIKKINKNFYFNSIFSPIFEIVKKPPKNNYFKNYNQFPIK